MSDLGFLTNPTARFGSKFSGCDSPDHFKNNLETMPIDWHYRNKQIHYASNKLGYRTNEFESISWKDSVVIFGCSNAFGIGLAEDETLDYRLSQMLNCPVINMGAGGTSMLFSVYNQLVLHNIDQPKAIVNLWTNTERMSILDEDRVINVSAHSSGSFSKEFFKLWNIYPKHSLAFSLMLQQMTKVLWKDIPHVECTYFESTSSVLNCELLEWEDKARDLLHPGHKTIDNAAKFIYSKL